MNAPKSSSPASSPEELACEKCKKPPAICVCDRIVPIPTKTRVLILQHPQEDDVVLGTARLLSLSLPNATLRVGLSWASLEAALEGVMDPARIDRSKWAAMFTSKLLKPVPELQKGQVVVVDRHGDLVKKPHLDGIVVLDGTWSQAKTLWWRNPWLLKLGRVLLRPKEPSIYGRLRKAPRAEWVSTLEAVAETLPALGEPQETREQLRRLLRTMVQRARDAREPDKEEKAPKGGVDAPEQDPSKAE
jgi:DTW domain-containing protein YfiP